jgi:DNA-binding response OmpR family regulator
VLIVEADREFAERLAEFLSHKGLDAILTDSAEEALNLARRLFADLAIVNMVLPGCDALQLTRKLLSAPAPLQVILMTGYSDEQSHMGLLGLGPGEPITATFGFDQLSTMIGEILGGAASEDGMD